MITYKQWEQIKFNSLTKEMEKRHKWAGLVMAGAIIISVIFG